MANGTIDNITSAVEDAVTYPILTREVSGYGGGGRSGNSSGLSSGGSLTRTAQSALRDLLGWRYRADDPKGFLAALNKAVDLKEVDGHVESTWKARPFMVQADLGEVTGAQASLYARARAALDHALPLLDGLQPLRPDADPENMASIRALIRSALTELVRELGMVGGPRIQRVDDYFKQLLALEAGKKNSVASPNGVQGQLGELAKRFGLDSQRVLSVAEEQNYTNFIILVDYANSLFQTWQAQRKSLFRNGAGAKFLGTELVRLSQSLAVIVESVQEVYAAMDSVFFGPEERQVALLEFGDGESITVAELLAWIEHFAGVEAPQFLEDSGKDGVGAVGETLNRIFELLAQVATA